ncbi:hypothetical protein [Kangiella sediminilitoris]|uniref:Coiled coil domain-containing protein n=1 Tax=Kangiella sediminilitoris TaxID=1144748 RepID=A0A1B3BAN4_9GAMM|nr:hypothetical protein [Kangiella sediminilitoris]AOE49859.1 hypothetical protein KS2013_1139 [Kangiella sediminilitoris]
MSEEKRKKEAQELYERIKAERDDLKLQAHLAKAELRDKWVEAEHQWESFSTKFRAISKGAGKAADDVGEGFHQLGKELKHAYEDLKQSIKSSKLSN